MYQNFCGFLKYYTEKFIIATFVILGVNHCLAQGGEKSSEFRIIQGDARNIGGIVSKIYETEIYTTFPSLKTKDGNTKLPLKVEIEGAGAKIHYEGGALANVICKDGEIIINFDVNESTLDIDSYIIATKLSFSEFHNGEFSFYNYVGSFISLGDERTGVIGSSASNDQFCICGKNGRGIKMTVQPNVRMRIQDNRKWDWVAYQVFFEGKIADPKCLIEIGVSAFKLTDSTVAKEIQVDRFGQSIKTNFSGKIHSEEELKQDIEEDKAYYSSFKVPQRDLYGGLPESGRAFGLKKTGFFHAQIISLDTSKEAVFVIVDPDGNAFFQLGVCPVAPGDTLTYVKGRESIYEWLPPYEGEYKSAFYGKDNFSFYLANIIRKYGEPYTFDKWSAIIMRRLRLFGFNSMGAFGAPSDATRAMNVPYTPILPLLKNNLRHIVQGFFDPFDPATIAEIDKLFAVRVAPMADDPLIFGYFLENEQLFHDIPKVVPRLGKECVAKRELVELIVRRHPESDYLKKSWGADSYDDAINSPISTKDESAELDLRKFTEHFIDTYFNVVVNAFRKYDHNHMLIGNRMLPASADIEIVDKISGKYLDVISINYYTDRFDPEYLRRIYNNCSKKPLLLSEWSYGTNEQGLAGGVRNVSSQEERGLAYRSYVEQAAALPFVVGVQWFATVDQALTGRWFDKYNGERMNIGIFNVTDRPYKQFIPYISEANNSVYDLKFGKKEPFLDPKFVASPQFQSSMVSERRLIDVPKALPGMKVDGVFSPWPNRPSEEVGASSLIFGKDAGGVKGSFWLCWDERNLYIFCEITDPTPCQNDKSPDKNWNGDAIEVFLEPQIKKDSLGGLSSSARQIIFGCGASGVTCHIYNTANIFVAPKQYDCTSVLIKRSDGYGYTLEAAIPFEIIGLNPKEGMRFFFDFGFSDDANPKEGPRQRTRQFIWSGSKDSARDDSYWGQATLVP